MSNSSSIMYPEVCRESIDRIVRITGVSVETAYAMMMTTAALMDLRPEDEKVVRMILTDCGYPEG